MPQHNSHDTSRPGDDARDRLPGWFLCPKGEHGEQLERLAARVIRDHVGWRGNIGASDPPVVTREGRRHADAALDRLEDELARLLDELKGNHAFHHPRYLAHMLSELLLPGTLGKIAGSLYNANNVTDEAAPVTVAHELEAGRGIATMLGIDPARAFTHLTSGGTLANGEALWYSRTIQMTPFALRELCRRRRLEFKVDLPNGEHEQLALIPDRTLLHLPVDVAIDLPLRLTAFLVEQRGTSGAAARRLVEEALANNPWEVGRRGWVAVARRLDVRPVVLAPATAHYSVKKMCNILGYGEEAVRLIPVDEHFRLDVNVLEATLARLPDDEYVAAVVAVVGSTEEGAVDPVHMIHDVRARTERAYGMSFHLHVDAAFGGYLASLLRGHDLPRGNIDDPEALEALAKTYAATIDVDDRVDATLGGQSLDKQIAWRDPRVLAALLALPAANSITVDPHKLGLIPYPAGVICFRNGASAYLMKSKANYIDSSEPSTSGPPHGIDAVGPYSIEGSKPASAATSVVLAQRTVPLTWDGHGQIMREMLLASLRFAYYLRSHRQLYAELEAELPPRPGGRAFTFVPLHEPDLNVVCYVARPMAVHRGVPVPVDTDLALLNALNESVHAKLSGREAGAATPRMPYGQPLYVSRTWLEHEQYAAPTVRGLLTTLGVTSEEYERLGLFVLRSALMNPLYGLARATGGKDHLLEALRHLHRVTAEVIDDVAVRAYAAANHRHAA